MAGSITQSILQIVFRYSQTRESSAHQLTIDYISRVSAARQLNGARRIAKTLHIFFSLTSFFSLLLFTVFYIHIYIYLIFNFRKYSSLLYLLTYFDFIFLPKYEEAKLFLFLSHCTHYLKKK